MIYCDTSALAKMYVPERQSAAVRSRLEVADQVFASELARTELMGVFHRQLRERKWTREKFQVAVRQFANDDVGGFWTWLRLDSAIVQAAASLYTTLPENIFLRSADSLHLVTAMQNGFSEILTYDAHQAIAAPVLGLKLAQA
jgi:predicted nucleic acid-binding protein